MGEFYNDLPRLLTSVAPHPKASKDLFWNILSFSFNGKHIGRTLTEILKKSDIKINVNTSVLYASHLSQ